MVPHKLFEKLVQWLKGFDPAGLILYYLLCLNVLTFFAVGNAGSSLAETKHG